MSNIEFSKDEKAAMVRKIQGYFQDQLDQEIERFDAEFLIDFLAKEIGPYFYNRGLYDTQALIEKKLESIGETLTDAIYEIEKPTEAQR